MTTSGASTAGTPEIAVLYTTPGLGSALATWPGGYGDLTAANLAWIDQPANGVLTPADGTQMLNRFQLARHMSGRFDQPIGRRDGSMTMLWRQRGTVAGAAADDPGVGKISTVPEPAEWTLLIVGFGIIGTVIRRRSRRLSSVSA